MVNPIRFFLALFCAKAALLLLRLLRRGATTFPGKLALKLCPQFLWRIGRPETLVVVTGTNGKTTVSNLLGDVFAAQGESIVANRLGANIDAGVATALLGAARLSGRCGKRVGVLEMDERSAKRVLPPLKPDYLIITNLFRDSPQRDVHPEFMASVLDANIPRQTKLILNGDDSISAAVAPLCARVHFGIDPLPFEPPARENLEQDARVCPVCGAALAYDFRRYHHIGRAHCTACAWRSPALEYQVIAADPAAAQMTVLEPGGWREYPMPVSTVHNLYNIMAVLTLLREMGQSPEAVAAALKPLALPESRFRQERVGRWTLTALLSKGYNPVACSRNFDDVANAAGKKAVLLMLDDMHSEQESSENIAWLYDADFEFLNTPDIVQIIPVGARALDSRLRLLLAGVPDSRITVAPRAEDAAGLLRLEDCENVCVLYAVYRLGQSLKVRRAIAERMRGEAERKQA